VEDEGRQADIEAELSFQGQSLNALNDALGQQQRDILLLRRQVELLAAEVKALRLGDTSPGPDGETADQKPPHY
jgi:SlyX protein